MSNAYIGAGIARGLGQAADYHAAQPERQARLREAEARAKSSELKLQQQEQLQPAQTQNELTRLEADTYNTNAQLAKQQSYDAFTRYQADTDVRHLNNWLRESQQNPVAKNTTAGMVRLDKMPRTREAEQMLRGMGITDIDGFYSDPKLSSSIVMGTRPDGTQIPVDMNRMFTATGYTRYATQQQQKDIASSAVLMQQLRAGANLSDIKANDEVVGLVAEATGLPREQVFNMLREEAQPGQGSSALERVAAQLRNDNPELSYRDSLAQAVELTSRAKDTNEETFVKDYMSRNPEATREDAVAAYREAGRDSRTSPMKNVEAAEEAEAALDEAFGGDFLTADLSNLDSKQTAMLNKQIRRIEQLGGVELSADDKKNARAIRKLMSLGKTAGEGITDAQAGPIDTFLRGFKSYFFNNVEGKDATTSYEAFRAIARNAIFGSQVSSADYKAFNQAFATLGMQPGPVLVSLRTQLEMLRDDMQSMSDLGDAYVAKARFGVSLEELDETINAIQDRVDIISRLEQGKVVEGIEMPQGPSGITVSKTPINQPPGEKKSLDEIFGGQ